MLLLGLLLAASEPRDAIVRLSTATPMDEVTKCAARFLSSSGQVTSKLTSGVNGSYVTFMAANDDALSVRFEMRSSERWIERVDDWRAQQKPIPSRAEAIRRLVEQGLSVVTIREWKPGDPPVD